MADHDPRLQLPVRPRSPRHIIDTFPPPGFPPLPIALSDFLMPSPHPSKRRRVEVDTVFRCPHSLMTRFYSSRNKCDICGRKGAFGWLYRCIVDRDALIMGRKAKGIPVAFDGIGWAFADKMSLGKHGPDVRHEDYSFLQEVTPEQMVSYTPEQIHRILNQRENVRLPIAQ